MGKRLVFAALVGGSALVVLAAGCSTSSAPASAALECNHDGRTYRVGEKRAVYVGTCEFASSSCECTGNPSAPWSCRPAGMPLTSRCGVCGNAFVFLVGGSYVPPDSPCNVCTCTENEADPARPVFVCTQRVCLDAGPNDASDDAKSDVAAGDAETDAATLDASDASDG